MILEYEVMFTTKLPCYNTIKIFRSKPVGKSLLSPTHKSFGMPLVILQ